MKADSAWKRYLLLGILAAAAAVLALGETDKPVFTEVQPETTAISQTQETKHFSREEAYEKDVAALQTLAQSGDTMAAQRLDDMVRLHQSELAIEEALKTAGFPDALVIAQGNAVAVMLPQAQLTKENSARILTLCMTYADVSAENIRLMDY